jgi:hypothetical protein
VPREVPAEGVFITVFIVMRIDEGKLGANSNAVGVSVESLAELGTTTAHDRGEAVPSLSIRS